MTTLLGYVDDPASWSQNSVISAGGHSVILTAGATSDIGTIIYLGAPLGLAGVLKVNFAVSGSPNGTILFGFVDSAAATSSTTVSTLYGFDSNRNTNNSHPRVNGAAGTAFTTWVVNNDGVFRDYYIAYSVSGGVITMKLYVGSVNRAGYVGTFTGAAPSFSTMRPGIEMSNGGAAAPTAVVFDQPTFETSMTTYPIENIVQYGWSASADVFWTTHPMADSYDWRVNGGAITNVADSTAPTARVTGLTNGTTYTFEVRPVSTLLGNGNWQSVTLAPQASVLWDEFNRGASATVIGSPVSGGPYTVAVGTWGIIGNQVYTSVATASSVVIAPGLADCDIQFGMPVLPSSTNSMGVLFRYVDASNFWLAFSTSASVITIQRRIATSAINLFSYAFATTDIIRIIAKGPLIYLYVNNVLRGWIYDTFQQTASTVGMWSSGNTVGRIDNLLVAPAPTDPTLGFAGITATALTQADITDDFALPHNGWAYRGRDSRAADLAGVS